MIAALRVGQTYDLGTVPYHQAQRMIAADVMQPIDTDRLENWDSLVAGLADADSLRGPDGEVYGVPLAEEAIAAARRKTITSDTLVALGCTLNTTALPADSIPMLLQMIVDVGLVVGVIAPISRGTIGSSFAQSGDGSSPSRSACSRSRSRCPGRRPSRKTAKALRSKKPLPKCAQRTSGTPCA